MPTIFSFSSTYPSPHYLGSTGSVAATTLHFCPTSSARSLTGVTTRNAGTTVASSAGLEKTSLSGSATLLTGNIARHDILLSVGGCWFWDRYYTRPLIWEYLSMNLDSNN
jgi:hypothetical protein